MIPGFPHSARPAPFARRWARMRCRRSLPAPARRIPASFLSGQPRADLRGGRVPMLQSHVVEIDGIFVGAAVRLPEGYKFVAVDVRLDGLDGRVLPTLAELRRIVRAVFFGGHPPPAAVVVAMGAHGV
jgi:hypothetical protein